MRSKYTSGAHLTMLCIIVVYILSILGFIRNQTTEHSNQTMFEKHQKKIKRLERWLLARWMWRKLFSWTNPVSLEESQRHDCYQQTINNVIDCILFGTPQRCVACSTGELEFSSALDQYICIGVSGSSSCGYIAMYPLRNPFVIPLNLFAASVQELGDGRLVVKNDRFIDWRFASDYHLLNDANGFPYATTIVNSDIVRNLNNVVQIQVYQHDLLPRYAFFYSWKRMETMIGQTEYCTSLSKNEMIAKFEDVCEHFRKKVSFSMCQESATSSGICHSTVDVIRSPAVQEYIGNAFVLNFSVRKLLDILENPWNKSSGAYSHQPHTLNVVEYDETLQPAGILSEAQLERGRNILKKIRGILSALKRGSKRSEDRLVKESNNFYSVIPHAAGLKKLPRLDTFKLLDEKCCLLDQVSETNTRMNREPPRPGCPVSDSHFLRYRQLRSEIQYVLPSSEAYSIVQQYLHDTSPRSKLGIVDLFRVSRKGEEKTFKSGFGNRHLLWHGSWRGNFKGILNTGMQINPPGVRKGAAIFGNGIYFSDVADKSFQYCGKTGDSLLLLADVALGRVQKAHYGTTITRKGDSLIGNWTYAPNSALKKYGPPAVKKDGYVVPLGAEGATEYIVFDPMQVCLRYLVRVRQRSQPFPIRTISPAETNVVYNNTTSCNSSTTKGRAKSSKSQTQK